MRILPELSDELAVADHVTGSANLRMDGVDYVASFSGNYLEGFCFFLYDIDEDGLIDGFDFEEIVESFWSPTYAELDFDIDSTFGVNVEWYVPWQVWSALSEPLRSNDIFWVAKKVHTAPNQTEVDRILGHEPLSVPHGVAAVRDLPFERRPVGPGPVAGSAYLEAWVNAANTTSMSDNGTRTVYDSGFVREDNSTKLRVDLVAVPEFRRVAKRFTDGAVKYSERNYLNADPSNPDEVNRFKAAAMRHLLSWMEDETDEDHFAGCVANLFMLEELRRVKGS